MKKGIIVLVVIMLLLLWFGGTFVSHRNAMVRKREAVNAAWSCPASAGNGESVRPLR